MKTSKIKLMGIVALSFIMLFALTACDNDDDNGAVDEITTYKVSFAVTPADATLTFDGEAVELTEGAATVEKSNGTYDYTVSAEGYNSKSGQVVVNGADETVEVELTEAVSGQEITKTGTLDTITGEGEEVSLEIDGEEYAVSASYPGVGRYLAQVDSQVYGSTITVTLKNNEVIAVEKIELVEDIDHIAFGTVVNPTYPLLEPDTGRVRGIEVVGADSGIAVVKAVGTESGVTGPAVQISMDRIQISGIEFDVGIVNITGSGAYDGSYVKLSDSSVIGDLNIASYDSDISLSTVEGDVRVAESKVTITAESVTGDVLIAAGAEDAVFEADEIDGDLSIQEDNPEITVANVTGTVTLGAVADLSQVGTVEGDLNINANEVSVSDIDVNGALGIYANDVVVNDSSFGILAHDNSGFNASLTNVSFGALNEELSMAASPTMKLEANDTFVVDLSGWTFNNVDWPLEDTNSVEVSANDVELISVSVPSDLEVNADDVTVDVEEIAGDLRLGNTFAASDFELSNAVIKGSLVFSGAVTDNAVFNEVTFADEIDFTTLNVTTPADNAPEFNGGVIEENITTLTGTAGYTVFDGVTFKEPVDNAVKTVTIDEFVFLNDVVFEGDVAVTSDLNLDTGFTGGRVEGDLDFSTGVMVRVVGTELQGNVSLTGTADVRLREVTINPSNDVTIDDAGALLLRDVTVMDNGNDVEVDGSSGMTLTLRGTIEGNGVTTFDNMTSYTFENSPVINDVIQADIANVTGVATFNNNTFKAVNTVSEKAKFVDSTFEVALGTISADAEFNGNTFEAAVTANAAGASFTDDTFEANLTVNDTSVTIAGAKALSPAAPHPIVTLTEADSVEFVDGEVSSLVVSDTSGVTTSSYKFSNLEIGSLTGTAGVVNDIDFKATFENNTLTGVNTVSAGAKLVNNDFDTVLTATNADAVFEANTFEANVTVTAGASFTDDTFEADLTVGTNEAEFEALAFDTDAAASAVNVNEDTVLNGLTVAGANDFDVVVASNKKVTFADTVKYSSLTGDFTLDITAPSSDYDNQAEWTPEFSKVVIAK